MKHTETSKYASLERLRIAESAIAPEVPPARQHRVVPLLCGALLCVALGAGAMWAYRPAASAPAPAPAPAAPSAAIAARAPGVLSVLGYVVVRDQTTVSAEATGRLLRLYVKEGDRVVAGQVLAQLANETEATRLKLFDSQARSAQVQLRQSELQATLQQSVYRRNLDLHRSGMVSAAALEQSEQQLDQARQHVEQAVLEVEQAAYNRKLAQTGYDNTFVRAPFAGTVLALNAQIGEIVSPLASAGFVRSGICTIADLNSQVIEFDINEKHLSELALGQPVDAVLDAYPEQPVKARISAIRAEVDRAKGTIKVQATPEHLQPYILPDMSVRVTIHRKTT